MFVAQRQRVQSEIERLGLDQQERATAARLRVDQCKLPESQARSAGPIQIVHNFLELRASHRHRLSAHSPTADARRIGLGLAEFLKQQRPSAVQPRAHRPHRATQRRGRFFVTHFFEFTENHHLAVILGQRRNRPTNAGDRLNRRKLVGRMA